MTPPLFGLVLAGGASTRMQRDKATLSYHGKPQLTWAYELLSPWCATTFVSVRPEQRDEPVRAGLPQIVDRQPGIGPIAGIAAALQEHPKAAWLVVACDLPFLDESTLRHLVAERDPSRLATAYRSSHDTLPEPLCAIWEPQAREAVLEYIATGKQCPRKLLINSDVRLIDLPDGKALDNINTADEYASAAAVLSAQPPKTNAENGSSRGNATRKTIRVQYFAILREQAGRGEDTLDTTASTAAELYDELRTRYPFKLAAQQLKVAVNADFSEWHTPLRHGDTVVFIPPVAGG